MTSLWLKSPWAPAPFTTNWQVFCNPGDRESPIHGSSTICVCVFLFTPPKRISMRYSLLWKITIVYQPSYQHPKRNYDIPFLYPGIEKHCVDDLDGFKL